MGQDCKYCGAYIAGRADKCPACGKRVNYKEPEGSYAYQKAEEEKTQAESKTYTYKDEYADRYGSEADRRTAYTKGYTNVNVKTAAAASGDDDVKENKLISYLCYFGPLFLVPYLLRPNSDFVKFHANQGLVLLIASFVGGILAGFVPVMEGLAGLAVELFVFVCFVKGLINVNHGEKKELPVIGGFKILK